MGISKACVALAGLVAISAGTLAPALGAGASARVGHAVAVSQATSPPPTGSSLAAAADSVGDQFLFWKGQDDNLWSATYDASTSSWTAAHAVTGMGPLGSQPSVVVVPPGTSSPGSVWVFWQGQDNNLWSVTGSFASGAPGTISWPASPSVVPGMGPLGSAPSVALQGGTGNASALWVFWKGVDANLWSVRGPLSAGSATWPASPSVVPGMATLGSAPSAGSDAIGDAFVFWQGSGNAHVWEAWYDNALPTPAWSPSPIDLGTVSGSTASPPSVAVEGSGPQFVFWQGQDANLWFDEWTGVILAGPNQPLVRSLGPLTPPRSWLNDSFNYVGMGPLGSQPVATVSAGAVEVFWKGTDGNIWTASARLSSLTSTSTSGGLFGAYTWTGPTSLGDGPLDGQ